MYVSVHLSLSVFTSSQTYTEPRLVQCRITVLVSMAMAGCIGVCANHVPNAVSQWPIDGKQLLNQYFVVIISALIEIKFVPQDITHGE